MKKLITDDIKEQKILERIRNYRLIDDEFMTKFFENELECTSIVLQIILENPTLKVISSVSQANIKNLHGRSLRLDVKATDSTGKIYDIEIQRASSGAKPKRARYHSSLLDANELNIGDDVDNLPETFVIFITENDIVGDGLPVYYVARRYSHSLALFGDETNIIYVNGSFRGDTPIGNLMHDFNCSNPAEMKNKVLAKRAGNLKGIEKEDYMVNKPIHEFIQEVFGDDIQAAKEEQTKEIILEMLKKNCPFDFISSVTKFPVEKIKSIAEEAVATV
ncbi:MAG: PD-(D/E)XK nuclease family transposase [Treponema sp.]|nr:PD-(D/E)XK nuclease family transposase [Spirochaetia bacterium]MDD7459062.1 PD-(D/E)XK nuclease family transposase [Spirochaetales bacterium]MEE1182513.1 PD-(D/E)XK nuclease family transposase [Treponema sp.]